MESERKQKEINQQIQTGIAEKDRLQTTASELEKHFEVRSDEIATELHKAETALEAKKQEAVEVQKIIDGVKSDTSEAQIQLTEINNAIAEGEQRVAALKEEEKESIEAEAKAREALQKTVALNETKKEEALSEVKSIYEAIESKIELKKEELTVLGRSVSKVNFIKDEAEKEASKMIEHNSELEKKEKALRNSVNARRTALDELEKEEVEITRSIRDKRDAFEVDKQRIEEAKEQRIKVESELEEVNKKLLQSGEVFKTKEMQLNSREEYLKEMYSKAGIEWPKVQ